MGERKGVNKYYPPDWTPDQGGINKYHGTHALRERARKLHMGILIIRFEMPYNIWCEGCKNHIGMGVRYNAEKKKIGMYYSTPVYQFRMKCHLCDNYFEIKTDPANLDYVIISGARRQERRWDPTTNEQDRKKTEKKLIAEDKELSNRGSLSINLLPKSDEDNRTAALLRLIPLQSPEEKRQQRQLALQSSSIFSRPREVASGSSSIKYIIKGKRSRDSQQEDNDLKKAKNDDAFNSIENPNDDESDDLKKGLGSGSCNEFVERNDVTSENALRTLCQYDSSSSSLGSESDGEVSGINDGLCVVERSLPNPFSASPNL